MHHQGSPDMQAGNQKTSGPAARDNDFWPNSRQKPHEKQGGNTSSPNRLMNFPIETARSRYVLT
jgi:hypothetical protein